MAYPHALPDLGYSYDALEPHIDSRTMEIHHTKHHNAYTTNLNKALEDQPNLQGYSADQLLLGLTSLPVAVQTAIRNNGGGFHNHSLFWRILAPGGSASPTGEIGRCARRGVRVIRRAQAGRERCSSRPFRIRMGLASRGSLREAGRDFVGEPGLAVDGGNLPLSSEWMSGSTPII